MAERANPSSPTKAKPNQRRRREVVLPCPRGAEEGSPGVPESPSPHTTPEVPAGLQAPALPAAPTATPSKKNGTTTATAASSQRQPTQSTRSARGEPGMASGTQSPPGSPEQGQGSGGLSTAPLTEAGLRQLGKLSSQQRVQEWLEANFPTRQEEEPGAEGQQMAKNHRKK